MPCTLQGYAVKAGMLVGRGRLLLFMDADGATRVSDLEKLEAALAAICLGKCALASLSEPFQERVDLQSQSQKSAFGRELTQLSAGNGMQETQRIRDALGSRGYQCAWV